jgi:hypothetical protein
MSMKNNQKFNIRFVAMSATQLAANNGAGFWNDSDGWGTYQEATKYTTETLETSCADRTRDVDLQWIALHAPTAETHGTAIPYRVVHAKNRGDKVLTVSDIDAVDDDDAVAKVEATFPGCDVYFTEPFNRADLSYAVYSATEDQKGGGFWNNDQGWTERQHAERFSAYERTHLSLPISSGADAQWVPYEYLNVTMAAELACPHGTQPSWGTVMKYFGLDQSFQWRPEQIRQYTQNYLDSVKQEAPIQVSLDGGATFAPAPEGVRVIYNDVMIPGEDGRGELHLNATVDGLIADVWSTRDQPLDHNIGTSATPLDDMVQKLVDANS